MITYCPRCGSKLRDDFAADLIDVGTRRCAVCALEVADPPGMLARSDEDEAEYDLAEWEPGERGAATATLIEADIPYRWEADLVLVVPAVAEEEVDALLDELAEVEELEEVDEDDGADGGEEAQSAMADLFVAADRLQHDPTDPAVVVEVLDAANVVGNSLPPYGIARPVWRRIQELSATVVTDLEEAVDEETVAADARTLREYLRDLV
jgi:hypothetical protein